MNGIPAQARATEDEPAEETSRDLMGYLAPLKRRWWLLVIIPVLLAFVAYTVVSRRPLSYSATTTLIVNPVIGTNGNPADGINAASLLTKTYSGFATSPAVLQNVATDLKLPETATQLQSLVTSTADPTSQSIRIAVNYRNAQGAADIANDVAGRFIAFLGELPKAGASQSSQALLDSINQARANRDNVAAQLATLKASPNTPTADDNANIAKLESLLQQYQNTYNGLIDLQQRLSVTQLSSQNSVSVVERASPPQHPAGSLRLLATAAALLGGFGLTVVGIVLADQARPRVRSRGDLARISELPVLVTVPRTSSDREIDVLHAPRSAMSEAIYALQTRLWVEARGNTSTTIMVTSAGHEEGTSAIAANLATAIAQAGHRVVLVDGKLHAPSLWKHFGEDAKHPGLSELAAVPTLTTRDVLAEGPIPDLEILLAGPVPVIPGERLTSERAERIFADLRAHADVVIIDAPPPLADSNTLIYAVNADHIVVVARAGRTRDDALRTTLASIRAIRARIFGIVLYDADRGGASA